MWQSSLICETLLEHRNDTSCSQRSGACSTSPVCDRNVESFSKESRVEVQTWRDLSRACDLCSMLVASWNFQSSRQPAVVLRHTLPRREPHPAPPRPSRKRLHHFHELSGGQYLTHRDPATTGTPWAVKHLFRPPGPLSKRINCDVVPRKILHLRITSSW